MKIGQNVTSRTIKATIKNLGYNLDDFEVRGNEIEGQENQTDKVVNTIVNATHSDCHGFKTGYGSWIYRFERQSELSRLAAMNID